MGNVVHKSLAVIHDGILVNTHTPFTSVRLLSAACCALLGLASISSGAVGTILLVVSNAASLDSQESAKRTLFQSWGYTVTTISDSATQAQFDAAALAASVVYVSETVSSGNVSTKLTNTPVGVVNEESALSDEFGMSASMTTMTTNQVNITNGSHYITSTIGTGTKTFANVGQPVRYMSGALGGFTTLGQQVGSSNPTFAVMERGDALTPSGTCAGRRVYLPFGNTGFDFNNLTTDGQTIVKRSIEWCMLPIAHWKLDDASGSVATDSQGGFNGTISGCSWTTGRIAGGLRLNGSTDYVQIANHYQFQVTHALTVAGWVKAVAWSSSADVSTILRKGDTTPMNWALSVTDGAVEFVLDHYDASTYHGNTVLPLNTWVHVAGVWDGVNAHIYVNGVSDATPFAKAAPIGTDTRPIFLGGRTGSTDVTEGVVDDVRFYNRPLTAAEIADLAKAVPKVVSWQQVAPQ